VSISVTNALYRGIISLSLSQEIPMTIAADFRVYEVNAR